MRRNIHNKPSTRQIQPMGLWGRLEAIRAPTKGEAKKGTKSNRPPMLRLAPQLLGTGAERASTHSATLATNMAMERPASDHASHAEATRVLNLPVPRSRLCSPASAVTVAPFYASIVFYSLRKALRDSGARKLWILWASPPAATASLISRSL